MDMKVIFSIKSAVIRSLKLWKGILVVWFSLFLLVSMLIIPMRAAINSGFGQSMITEKLKDGFNLEVFTELGTVMNSVTSFFSSGFLMVILIGLMLNAFFTGGVFDGLRESTHKFSTAGFFSTSAKKFWSFLVITVLTTIMILFLAFLIIGIPMTVLKDALVPEGGSMFRLGVIVSSIFFLFMAILLLVADYARAWQVMNEKNECFKAIGFGFSQTFRNFWSSIVLMILILVIQGVYGLIILKLLPGIKPVTGGGVFLLFLISQLLFIFKILLKVVRYGSVTALMEKNADNLLPETPNPPIWGA
jgi:hypothetical protein